jgi:hypothetical protein
MKTFMAALAATTALGLIAATPANALLQIAFTDGTNVVTCFDNQSGCDIDSGAGGLLKIFTTVGNFKITATVATSVSGPVNNLELTNAVITNTGKAAGQLKFVVGDTGYTAPVKSILEGASLTFNNNIGPTSFLDFYADVADGQPAGPSLSTPGIDLFTATGFATTASQAFAGNNDSPFVALSGFSMAEGATLNMLGGASVTGFSQSMTTSAVPEASTWMMFGGGFGLLALMGLRRKNGARFAL